MTTSKVAMQFGQAQFSAEGTEDFVTSMLEKWTGLASEETFGAYEHVEKIKASANAASTTTSSKQTAQKFENVFDEIDGKVKIIAHMPGANKAERTRNTALALLYANHLQGEASTNADDIRAACQDQGCYDSSNFASHLKGLKDKIATNTKAGGGYDVKLTAPGRKAAQSFVEGINSAAE